MTETVIKIESNPYEECIRYYRLDGGWHEITLATNPGSALHSEKLVHGFFPFKAEEIAKVIVGEFGSGDKIKLVFEGSDDEWEELKAICDESGFASTLYAVRSERHLANARDVLPEIIEVFKEIKPLVDDSVSQRKIVAEKIDRFTDVSSDIIPLCVLGNYSAGKSTFINALVGMEILPNGDEPVTARVFQIKRSKDRDRAMIQFSCGDRRFLLRFDPAGLMENKDLAGEALYDLIVTNAAKAETGMASQINAALKVLNSYRQDDSGEKVPTHGLMTGSSSSSTPRAPIQLPTKTMPAYCARLWRASRTGFRSLLRSTARSTRPTTRSSIGKSSRFRRSTNVLP